MIPGVVFYYVLVHPRLRTHQDFDKEKACVPGDTLGDHTPRGTAHAPPPANPHDSGGRVPTSGVRLGKHLRQKEPEGLDACGPSLDLQATVRAGLHFRIRAEGEANAPEGGQEESRLPSLSPGAPDREDPLSAHRSSPAQVGSGPSVSAATGACGDAGQHGQAAPEPGSGAPRWSLSLET